MNRPNKDEYYMTIATVAALRSTCISRQVGCIIVKDDNPISFGFSGPCRKMEHCEDIGGCRRRAMPDYKSGKYLELCPSTHAEQNAVAFAARHGIALDGATAYVSTYPCKDCMNSLINAGIKKIIYNDTYEAELSKRIAEVVGVDIEKYNGKEVKDILKDAITRLK